MDFMTTLTAVTQALQIAKTVSDIDKSFDVAEHKLRMAEIITTLAEAKIALSEAKADLAEKDTEIARLKTAATDRTKYVEAHGFYFLKKENGLPTGDAYCPKCIVDDGVAMKIVAAPVGHSNVCVRCKSSYQPRLPTFR